MPTRTIETSGLRLEICPEAGASIVGFEFAKEGEWVPVMRPTPPVAVAALSTDDMASFVLAPVLLLVAEKRTKKEICLYVQALKEVLQAVNQGSEGL